jgi:hypothetical protein
VDSINNFLRALYPKKWDSLPKEIQKEFLSSAFMKISQDDIDWSTPIVMDEKDKLAFKKYLIKDYKSLKLSLGGKEVGVSWLDQLNDTDSNEEELSDGIKEELEENRYDDYDNQISLLPPLESEAVRLLIEPDLQPSLTLSFSETGRKMILRRAYIRLMWLKEKPTL